MAFYMDEEQVWKCPKHPSKRRKTGICPKCLRERLITLCPNCASDRPCDCSPAPVDSSTSSSASFSLFSFSRGGSRRDFGTGNVDSDPTLRKSRSVAVSFLRSRSKHVGTEMMTESNKAKVSRSKINFWSVFTVNNNKSKKCDHVHNDEDDSNKCDDLTSVDDNSMMMMRSRSVAVGTGNGFTPVKQKGWYFPSPIKAFRHSKPPRSVAVS